MATKQSFPKVVSIPLPDFAIIILDFAFFFFVQKLGCKFSDP